MNIQIVDRSHLTKDQARQQAALKLEQTFSRFADRVADVTLVIADENGPKGGIDKSCRLTVKLRNSQVIRIQCHADDIGAAIAQAADRASQNLARTVGKRKMKHRREVGLAE